MVMIESALAKSLALSAVLVLFPCAPNLNQFSVEAGAG